MKKVCFISLNDFVPWGGSEDLWHQTALSLSKSGVDVSVIFFDWKQRRSHQMVEVEQAGIRVVNIPLINTKLLRVRRFLNPLLGDVQMKIVQSSFAALKPDVVVVTTTAPNGAELVQDLIRLKIPYVLNIQLADELLWRAYSDAIGDCYRLAATVYFLAEKNRNATEKQLGFRLLNARKHYNPIKNSSSVKTLDASRDVINFACVGRMGVEHKRQDLILEVLSNEVWKTRPWNLHFYGKGEHQESLVRLAAMYGLQDRVFFNGHLDDIDVVWNRCHALLLPSTYEAVPMAVTEAMKCGRVVVVTDIGFASEYVEDGINGFKCASATLGEFGAALERSWQQRSSWNTIAVNARATIEKHYPVDAAHFFAEEIISHIK